MKFHSLLRWKLFSVEYHIISLLYSSSLTNHNHQRIHPKQRQCYLLEFLFFAILLNIDYLFVITKQGFKIPSTDKVQAVVFSNRPYRNYKPAYDEYIYAYCPFYTDSVNFVPVLRA